MTELLFSIYALGVLLITVKFTAWQATQQREPNPSRSYKVGFIAAGLTCILLWPLTIPFFILSVVRNR